MSVPALITVSGALIASNPGVLVPIVALYAANAAVRTSYDAATYKIDKDNSEALETIARALSGDGPGVSQYMYYLNDLIRSASSHYDDDSEHTFWNSETLVAMMREMESFHSLLQELNMTVGTMAWFDVEDGEGDEERKGLAQILYEKVMGLQDCTLQINAVDPTQLQDYAETWTMF